MMMGSVSVVSEVYLSGTSKHRVLHNLSSQTGTDTDAAPTTRAVPCH
jgi:hypothetical protein